MNKPPQTEFLKGVDYVCISDNYWLGKTKPCLTYGLRGMCYFFLEIEGGTKVLPVLTPLARLASTVQLTPIQQPPFTHTCLGPALGSVWWQRARGHGGSGQAAGHAG